MQRLVKRERPESIKGESVVVRVLTYILSPTSELSAWSIHSSPYPRLLLPPMLSTMPAIYIHAAAFDPAASSVPSAPGKILARRLGLARKTKKVASAPVPAPVPRTMAGLKLDYALLSLEVAQDRRRELPCGAFDIGCALVSLDVAQGRKEISHRVLRF